MKIKLQKKKKIVNHLRRYSVDVESRLISIKPKYK